MAIPPSTPPPRTAQGCRLSSRLVVPELLLDKAHGLLPPRHWQASLQARVRMICASGWRWGWAGMGPPESLYWVWSYFIAPCFLFCGVSSLCWGLSTAEGAGERPVAPVPWVHSSCPSSVAYFPRGSCHPCKEGGIGTVCCDSEPTNSLPSPGAHWNQEHGALRPSSAPLLPPSSSPLGPEASLGVDLDLIFPDPG